ncbi:hypothetical protein T484DRAFT_1637566, partial [Baffinella frigidus]
HPTPYTLHPTPYTLHPKPQTLHPKPQTPNPKPQTPNPEPQTPNPEPQTPNPEPGSPSNRHQPGSPITRPQFGVGARRGPDASFGLLSSEGAREKSPPMRWVGCALLRAYALHSGIRRDLWPILGCVSVTLSVGATLCPYGLPTVGA